MQIVSMTLRRFCLLAVLLLTGASAAPVDVVYAGSLVGAMERGVGPAFMQRCGCAFHGEGKGSVALAKLIAGGLRHPDVFISADPAVLDGLMRGQSAALGGYTVFGTARLVLGYSRTSHARPLIDRIAAGKAPLSALFRVPGLRIGRTDPRLDPKGYRTLLAMQLASRHFHDSIFETALGAPDNPEQLFPEETLLVRLESGDLDVAFLYSTETATRSIPAIELPDDVNLGHPALAGVYRTAHVAVEGRTITGAPIAYAIAILRGADHPTQAAAFVRYVLQGQGRRMLERSGLFYTQPLSVGMAP